MADPLREALAALAEQWSRFGRALASPRTAHAADLRDLLAAHPEPAEPPAPEGAVRRVGLALLAVVAEARAVIDENEDACPVQHALLARRVRELDEAIAVAWVPRPKAEQVVEGRVAPEGE